MSERRNSYETIMIFSVLQGEETVAALSEKFKTLIAANSEVGKVDDWGKRRLAYPINDELEGFYIYIEFKSGKEFPAELDRIYKITDGVLRTMIIRTDEE